MAQRAPDAASGPRTVAATVAATIAIDRPPAFLRDGMSADVDILTTDIPRAIVLPGDAIRRDESSAYVYVVRDGAVHREPVKLGASNENGSLIEAGLQPGDVVIVGSADGLNVGTPVAPATAAPR